MNERIFELAEQAHEETYRAMGSTYLQEAFDDFYTEKFAELIVQECIDIAGKEDFDVMMKEGYPCSQTAKKIREHFGVEE